MRHQAWTTTVAALVLVVAHGDSVAQPVSAQEAHAAHRTPIVAMDLLERPVALRTGIGASHDAVGTRSSEAQAFYDQGLAYLHSYVWIDAARSFNQAVRLDPKLAMAEIGLSYALVELNASIAAQAALERARALAPSANAHDRRHISVRIAQVSAEEAPHDPAKLIAYRRTLDEALEEWPSDEELWLLRGVAEAPDPTDRGQGGTAGSVRFYDRALALGQGHFAAHHYLTHAYENIGRVEEALAHGQAYARMAPAVPHARHMYGHNLRRVGRIDEAVREFEAADRLETEYLATEHIPPEYDWHYEHNLDLLAASYQYLGQMQKAERLLRDAFAIRTSLLVQAVNKREWPAFLLSRGRIDDALTAASTLTSEAALAVQAAGHVEAGRALLERRRFAAAADQSNAALALLKSDPAGADLVAPALQRLEGEFFLRTGQNGKGRALLQQFLRKARGAPGPDAWTGALFALEAIARLTRETGDWEFAGEIAGQMLEHDPMYAGTHYALALVAEHRGDRRTASTEYALAERYWSKADSDLPELQLARASLERSKRATQDKRATQERKPAIIPRSQR